MIEFHTLGKLDLRRTSDGAGDSTAPDPSDLLTQSKPTALLTYLLLARSRGMHRRDQLVAMFWPELDHKRSRAALSQALYLLRKSLGPEVLESRGVEEVGVAARTIWCDALEFRAALEDDRPEDALALYDGDLLPGFYTSEAIGFERWLDAERMELSHLAAGTAWQLAERSEALGNVAAAGHWARRAVKLRPYDESAVQRLMEMLARLGDRSGALRVYEAFRERSIEELEIEPSEATEELTERIRASAAGPMCDPTAIEPSVAQAAASHRSVPTEADVTGVAPRHETADLASEQPIEPNAGQRDGIRTAMWTTAVAAILVAGVVLFEGLGDRGPRAAAAAAGHHIVVLPIEAVGEADTQRARMMTMRLIDDLARAGFRLPSYRAITGLTDSIPSLYRSERGPEWLVEGTLYEAEGVTELSIRIIDPRSRVQVWAQPFHDGGRSSQAFALHVARTTADRLAHHMGIETERVSIPSITDDPTADSLYTLGRYLYDTNYSLQGMQLAADAFRGAIAEDSTFVPAYVYLGFSLSLASRAFWSPPPTQAYPGIVEIAERAHALDPANPDLHALLGWLAYIWHWDWTAAERHFRMAMDLDPDNGIAHDAFPFVLLATGRFEEGLEVARRQVELQPLSPLAGATYCWHLWLANAFERAKEECERVLTELDPGYLVALGALRSISFILSSPDERKEYLSLVRDRSDRGLNYEAGPAVRFGLTGDTAQAREETDWEKTQPGVRPFRIANGYIWAGQADSAFVWLEKAIETRDPYLPEIAIRPWTIPYYDDPRFEKILQRLDLPPWYPEDRPHRIRPVSPP